MIKKYLLIILVVVFFLLKTPDALAQFVIQGPQGGTNIGSTGAGNIGNCLKVSSVSPLVWTIGSCGTGGGGGSGDSVFSRNNNIGLIYHPTTTDSVLLGAVSTTTTAKLEIIGGLFANASSTINAGLTVLRSTTTSATTTNLAISSLSSELLKVNATGAVIEAISGTDYSNFGASVGPTELEATDFGDWTCNGTTCTLDATYLTAVTANSPLSGSGTVGSPLVLSTSGTWSGNAGTATALAANGTNCSAGNYPLGVDASGNAESCTAANTGTVTAVSVASANGFAGSSSGGATPALTLSTTITGVLKGNGTAISAASNGTDYTLISATTCGGTDKVSAISASGAVTCTADSGGSGGTGNVATSTAETAGQLPYWTSTNGTPATLGSVATTSVTCSGDASCTPFTVIGSSPITITSTGGAGGSWATTSENYYWSQFRDWSIVNGSLSPTTTLGILVSASSSITRLSSLNSTSTNATSTNLTVSGTTRLSGLNCSGNANGGALTTDANGFVSCSDDDGGAGGSIDGGGLAGMMTSWTDSNTIQATSTIVGATFHGTSTTATSTFANAVHIDNYLSVGPDLYSGTYPGLVDTFSPGNYIADFAKDTDDYVSVNVANPNAGTNAASALTFNNNLSGYYPNSDAFHYYGEVTLNSSTFNNSIYGATNIPNALTVNNSDGPVLISAATSSTAGYVSILAGGVATEDLRITSGGNVGIGTSSPSANLSITGRGNQGNQPLFIISSSTAAFATTTKLIVDSQGRVAINPLGTNPLNAQFNVFPKTGSGISDDLIRFFNIGGSQTVGINASGVYTGINIDLNPGSGATGVNVNQNASGIGYNITAPAAATANMVRIQKTGRGIVFAVDRFGQLSIGSSTPSAMLSITSSSTASTTLSLNAFSNQTADILQAWRATTTKAFVVEASGDVGVGTSTPWRTFGVNGTIAFNGITTSTAGNAICIVSGGEVVTAGGTTCTTSSVKTKKDIESLVSDDTIMQLRTVKYQNKEGGDVRYGLIAEEVAKIDPTLVEFAKTDIKLYDGAVVKAGEPISVDYQRSVLTKLIKFVQDLAVKVTGIEKKLLEQDKQLKKQQEEINTLKKLIK